MFNLLKDNLKNARKEGFINNSQVLKLFLQTISILEKIKDFYVLFENF